MSNKVYKSYEAFAAAKQGGKVGAVRDDDPLAKFYRSGWWHTGEIVEFSGDSRVLPTTVKIETIEEAKEAAQRGWTPVDAVREEVFALFLAFYKGPENLPKALKEAFELRKATKTAEAQASAKPKP